MTHLYGLTECYGPATICVPQPGLDALPLEERAAFMARQGVNHPTLEDATVLDPATMLAVPADGATMGEVMLRGNTVMKGYLRNPAATEAAFAGGWFHTGDLGVLHPDGYIEVKDRAKDIVISGGENISTLEVEEVLYAHPSIMEAAVVARPDPKWGEVPHAFVTPSPGAGVLDGGGGRRLVPGAAGGLQGSEGRDLRAAAEDLDGQDPEVRAAAAVSGRRRELTAETVERAPYGPPRSASGVAAAPRCGRGIAPNSRSRSGPG